MELELSGKVAVVTSDDGVAATVGRATGADPVREQAVAEIPSGRFYEQ